MNDTILLYISAVCSVIAIVVLVVDWLMDIFDDEYITSDELKRKYKDYKEGK